MGPEVDQGVRYLERVPLKTFYGVTNELHVRGDQFDTLQVKHVDLGLLTLENSEERVVELAEID